MTELKEQQTSRNRDAEAVAYFAEKLQTGNKYDRLDAVFSLSDYDSTEAIAALTGALEDTYSHVRETAHKGLREIGRRSPGNIIKVLNAGIPGQILALTKIFYKVAEETTGGKEKALSIICRMILEKKFPGHAFADTKGTVIVSYPDFYELRNRLVEIGSEAVEPLAALLGSPEPTFRNYSIRILAEIGIAWAIEPLISQLGAGNVFARWKIKRLLRSKTRDYIVKNYLEKTRDNTPYHKSLMNVRESAVVKPLIYALSNRNRYVRGGAAQILYKLGWRPQNPVETAIYLIARGRWNELPALGSAAVAPLFDVLKDEDFTIQSKAAAALRKIYPSVTPGPFIAALKDKDQHVRGKAAGILAHFGWRPAGEAERIACLVARKEWDRIENPGKEGVTLLTGLLKDGDRFVRKNAVNVLGKVGRGRGDALPKNGSFARDIIRFLIGCLNDDSPYVRDQAIDELSMMGEATRLLLAALENPARQIRQGAAETLKKAGWQPRDKKERIAYYIAAEKWPELIPMGIAVIEPLLKMAGNEGYAFLEKTAETLSMCNSPAALERLIKKLNTGSPVTREIIIAAFGDTGSKRVINSLLTALEAEDAGLRKRAAHSLGHFSLKQVAEALVPHLRDHSLIVRKRAEEALLKVRETETLLPFIKTFSPKDPVIQQEVAFILEETGWQPGTNRELACILFARPGWEKVVPWNTLPVGDRDAVEILIEQLQRDDLQTRGQAVKALGRVGDARVLDPLLNVLYKRNFYDKWHKEAEETFKQIRERFITWQRDLVCRRCFLRYKELCRHYPVFQQPTYEFYACPKCGCDSDYFKDRKIVLRVDRGFKETFSVDNTIIYVNWFRMNELCDYDEILI